MSTYTARYQAQYGKPENSRGHVWKREEDGDLDIFAMAEGNHNGPECVKCGYSFCHHCHEGPQEDCPKADSSDISHNP